MRVCFFCNRWAATFFTLGGMSGALAAAIVNFDDCKTGSPPPGWLATKTGQGEPRWSVVPDQSAPSAPNVLKQSGEATFPVCIKQGLSIKDGFVQVSFKPVSGKEDQAGGVIWRCKDANNYYIARANALEDNVTIYQMVEGKRVAFKSTKIKVAPGVWHTLRVEFRSNRFAVMLDGTKVIEAQDGTFSEAGGIGVWTKADSITLFDDFSYEGQS